MVILLFRVDGLIFGFRFNFRFGFEFNFRFDFVFIDSVFVSFVFINRTHYKGFSILKHS